MGQIVRESVPKAWSELMTELAYEDPACKKRMGFSFIFRGVSDAKPPLVPSLGREKIYRKHGKAAERRLLDEFRYRFAAQIDGRPYDEWELLAFAQHVGVPTRLLDWSTSQLIALFFALCADNDKDRAVYCFSLSKHRNEVAKKERLISSPFDVKTVRQFSPPLSFPRLRNQRGVFTVQPDPGEKLPLDIAKKIIIDKNLVGKFRSILFQCGMDYAYVYPDEEGIGQQLKWHAKFNIGLGLRSGEDRNENE